MVAKKKSSAAKKKKPPGAKRKPPEDVRSERLDIRLTPGEHEALTEAAHEDGADSMSEWVRTTLVRIARRLKR